MTPEVLIATVGANIRYYRRKAGLTQTEAAKRVGMVGARLSNIETGQTACGIDTVAKIAAVLGVPPWKLLKPRSTDPIAADADTPSPE